MVPDDRAYEAQGRGAVLQCLQPSEFWPPKHGAGRHSGKAFHTDWLWSANLHNLSADRLAGGWVGWRQQSPYDRVSGSAGVLTQNRPSHETIESPMIQLSSAGKRYGHKLLFEGVDWLITNRDRVGLVGANGTGKSTLMKILGELETLDYGSISLARGITAGYLPQDGLELSGRSVFAECMSVFDELRSLEQQMEELTGRMSELDQASPEYSQVAERYQRMEHEFRANDGF